MLIALDLSDSHKDSTRSLPCVPRIMLNGMSLWYQKPGFAHIYSHCSLSACRYFR